MGPHLIGPCPHKKEKFGARERHAEKEDHVKAQGESHLQDQECPRPPEARGEGWKILPQKEVTLLTP